MRCFSNASSVRPWNRGCDNHQCHPQTSTPPTRCQTPVPGPSTTPRVDVRSIRLNGQTTPPTIIQSESVMTSSKRIQLHIPIVMLAVMADVAPPPGLPGFHTFCVVHLRSSHSQVSPCHLPTVRPIHSSFPGFFPPQVIPAFLQSSFPRKP